MVTTVTKLRLLLLRRKLYDKPRQHIKKQRHHFANKGLYSQRHGFSGSCVRMWVLKKCCFWIVVWRRHLRVPCTARRSNQSILKEINLNIHWKDWCWSWSSNTLATWCEEPTHWKDSDARQDWRQKEKGAAEDVMVGWHHWLSGHEFEQTPGDSEGQGSLACCCPWGHKELEAT